MTKKNSDISAEDKKLLKKCYWGSLACMRTTSSTSGIGRAMVLSAAPIIEKYYKTDEEKKEAIYRHATEFHNTNQTMFGLIAGITCAMEKERAEKGVIDAGVISGIKASLMGPLAGFGDSFFFNCVRVIIAGICIGIASTGNIMGPLLFILLFGCGLLAVKYVLFMQGYKNGIKLVDKAYDTGIIPMLMEAAGILGAVMVGCLISTNVMVTVVAAPVINGATIDIQGMFDNIMPGLLSVALWWGCYKLLQKGLTPIKMIFLIMGACIVLSFLGIL